MPASEGDKKKQGSPSLSMNRTTPNPSQEGNRHRSASCPFASWEGLGVGSWSQCMRKRERRLSENRNVGQAFCLPLSAAPTEQNRWSCRARRAGWKPALRYATGLTETAWQVNGTPLSTIPYSPMWFRIFLLGMLLVLEAQAQEGDEAGEVQRSLVPRQLVPPAPPLSPDRAVKTFRLQPGFRLELVAADPLVQNPIQIAFDPDGRIWVV